jgi:Alpha amylase, C-terminal all-beta domain
VVCNFTPFVRRNYLTGVPRGGFWGEILNSDAQHYGGSGQGNLGGRGGGAHPSPRAVLVANLDASPAFRFIFQVPRMNEDAMESATQFQLQEFPVDAGIVTRPTGCGSDGGPAWVALLMIPG